MKFSNEEWRNYNSIIKIHAKNRKKAEKGLIAEGTFYLTRVLNEGKVLEIKREEKSLASFRINMDDYDMEILELVDNQI